MEGKGVARPRSADARASHPATSVPTRLSVPLSTLSSLSPPLLSPLPTSLPEIHCRPDCATRHRDLAPAGMMDFLADASPVPALDGSSSSDSAPHSSPYVACAFTGQRLFSRAHPHQVVENGHCYRVRGDMVEGLQQLALDNYEMPEDFDGWPVETIDVVRWSGLRREKMDRSEFMRRWITHAKAIENRLLALPPEKGGGEEATDKFLFDTHEIAIKILHRFGEVDVLIGPADAKEGPLVVLHYLDAEEATPHLLIFAAACVDASPPGAAAQASSTTTPTGNTPVPPQPRAPEGDASASSATHGSSVDVVDGGIGGADGDDGIVGVDGGGEGGVPHDARRASAARPPISVPAAEAEAAAAPAAVEPAIVT